MTKDNLILREIIFNRTFDKIKNTRMLFKGGKDVQSYKIRPEKIDNLIKHVEFEKYGRRRPSVIINTTPTNILSNNTDWNIKNTIIGFDIVYRPREGTGFLNCFHPKNRIEGINMLIYQAVPSFKLWFGVEPEIDEGIFNVLYKKMDNTK